MALYRHSQVVTDMNSQQLWLPAQDLHNQATLHVGMYTRVAKVLLINRSIDDFWGREIHFPLWGGLWYIAHALADDPTPMCTEQQLIGLSVLLPKNK